MGMLITDGQQAKDVMLAKMLGDRLDKLYPGYLWWVDVNSRQGFINVKNLFLSGKWGFRIDLKGIYSSSELEKDIMRAGGELLERYRMARSGFNEAQYRNLRTDFKGDLIVDRG